MPTYLVLSRFTEQGIRSVQDTLARERQLLTDAEGSGLTIKSLYYLQGDYDIAGFVEVPNDLVMQAAAYAVRRQGNVQLTYYRAFGEEEMTSVVNLLP